MKNFKRLRRLVTLVLSVTILGGGFLIASAKESETVEKSYTIEVPLVAENNDSSPLGGGLISTYGAYLNYGTASITYNGNGNFAVSGTTFGHSTNEGKLTITLYLQRESGGAWATINTYSNTATNKSYVSVAGSTTVATGSRYRVYGVFTVTSNGVTESATGYTQSILPY